MGRKSCKTSENKGKSPRFLPSFTFSKERAILVPGLMFDTPTLTNQLINSKVAYHGMGVQIQGHVI